MSNRGFWLFMEVDGSKDQTFVLLNNLMIKKQERLNIYQDIAKGYAWKSVQMFEWNNELFVCFSTSGKTLVVIRLKTLPDQIDAHGTYISSFYVESTTNPEAFFLPTYPYPIFYYSRSEKDKVRVFHSIELKDIIKESDKGFDECKKEGRYPSNFLRLRPYIKNLTRVAANTPHNCESFDIPLFFWNQSTPCFELGPDVFPTSLDMYTVALGFNAKVLSYIERDEDVRCNLSKCGESMANCVGQKINSKELIVSTYWGLDDFALIRWTVSGSRLKFRLLNCDYFNTCPLCTLYGGLSCVWSSSKCQVKDKSSEISQEPCFAEVAVIKEQLPPNKMILTVRLPYKLNSKVGENVSIKLDGQEFTNVKFVSDVYKVETADLSFGVGMIVIKRGSYFMNSTIRFQKQESSIILEIILYLILIVVILTVGLGLIAFLILRDKKNAINIDPDPSPGPMPANT